MNNKSSGDESCAIAPIYRGLSFIDTHTCAMRARARYLMVHACMRAMMAPLPHFFMTLARNPCKRDDTVCSSVDIHTYTMKAPTESLVRFRAEQCSLIATDGIVRRGGAKNFHGNP